MKFLQFVLFLSGRDSKTLNDGLHCRTEKVECIHLRDPKIVSRLIMGVRIKLMTYCLREGVAQPVDSYYFKDRFRPVYGPKRNGS